MKTRFAIPFGLVLLCILPAAALHKGNAGPKEFEIRFKLPPPAVRTPEQQRAEFVLAEPGLEIQLVAAEPLIETPVAISFDARGRLFVCEMRGYMRDVEGATENLPTGRVSLLTDTDGDGRMDQASVFVDKLVMPRAVLAVGRGALVAEPPRLTYYEDTDGDGVADQHTVVASDYGRAGGQPEHMANSPTWMIDNWIAHSNYSQRHRFDGKAWIAEPHPGRGQWGLTRDDTGRTYFNYNSTLLSTDHAPAVYASRNPNLATRALFNTSALRTNEVWPGHPTPGINRGYAGGLRDDGSLKSATGTCGPGVYRGDALPPEFLGDIFIPEPCGNLVKRVKPAEKDGLVETVNTYQGREFLTSPDERFRPVNCLTGPDGALYIVDMYRGIVQHSGFLTHYLVANIEQRKLVEPYTLGRLWRVVRKGQNPRPVTVPEDAAARVTLLGHANGWVRDTAQRVLAESRDPAALPLLRETAARGATPLARLHALWLLEAFNDATPDRLTTALDDADPRVRAAALRLSERWLGRVEKPLVLPAVLKAAARPDTRLQAALTLSALVDPAAEAALLDLLAAGPVSSGLAEAVASGLRGREAAFLARAAADARLAKAAPALFPVLGACALKEGKPDKIRRLLEAMAALEPGLRSSLLKALGDASDQRKGKRIYLAADGSALGAWVKGGDRKAWDKLDAILAWPGKPGVPPPPVIKPLDEKEQALFARGKGVYDTLCTACHQADGLGLAGLAPPLADSEWVTGPEARLARIVLHGVSGKLKVLGVTYDMEMPALPQLADEDVAGVLTYLRRAWDHGASPVSVQKVAAIRAETASRATPWTQAELEKIK